MSGSSERTRAIILRRTNYGEADRILKLLTPHGQISAMARGVRREKSRLAGGVELFAISDMTLHQGKGDMRLVTSTRLEVFFDRIIGNYDRLEFGYEATRLITKASDSVDTSEWFVILEGVYQGLNELSIDLKLTQIWFYLRYAEATGYALSLSRDVDGNSLQSDERYVYDVSERGLRQSEQGNIAADHIKFLRLVAAKPIMTVAQIGGTDAILADCYDLARRAAAL